jgi:O-succinylbenzoate synthase
MNEDRGPLPSIGAPVTRAEVLEVSLPLMEPFVTGFGSTDTRRTVLVHLRDADGAEGWGEAAALDHPFYLPDTTSGSLALICEWALPIGLKAGPDPLAVAQAMSTIRGNTFARAGVESAFWCLEAARDGVSLATLFCRKVGGGAASAEAVVRRAVPVGESIGIHPTVASTLAEVDRRLGEGYQRVKLKVKPGWDVEVVAAVRQFIGPEVMLQVDANASYSATADDMRRLEELDGFGLSCIEQPLGWDDLLGHVELQRRLSTPICLDESLRSADDVRRALLLGACRNVNLKPGRVGGVAASIAIHDLCVAKQVPLWCGGMLESGIGRAVNLALCSLPGFTDPADMSPASVLYAFDLVEPTYEVSADGTIEVPTAPGLGFDVARDRVADLTLRRYEVPPAL